MVLADVTVVIPCYNSAHTIRRAVESVKRQSLQPLEVVVVDDGSTEPLLGDDVEGCTVIRQDHHGAAAARNVGWRAARSPWIAFLDADDEWLTDKLERMLELATRRPEATVLYSDVRTVTRAGQSWAWSSHAPPHDGRVLAQLLLGNFIAQPSVVVRRDALERHQGYDESFDAWEDIDLWLRLARTEVFAYCPLPLVVHHLSDSSLSLKALAMASGRLRSTEAALDWPEVMALPRRLTAAAMALALLQMSEARYLLGDSTVARSLILRSVSCSPRAALTPRTALLFAKSFLPHWLRVQLRRKRYADSDGHPAHEFLRK